ncbi:MAG: hypothetical protein AAF961_13425, partial [Planctomycetota bacterium]
MFTTLGTGLLVSPENLENYGVDSETAMWVALGVGIGASLICGIGMWRMAHKSTTAASGATQTGAGASSTGAQAGATGAKAGATGAKAGANTGSTGVNASARTSASGSQASARTGAQSTSARSGSQAAGGADDVARSASTST